MNRLMIAVAAASFTLAAGQAFAVENRTDPPSRMVSTAVDFRDPAAVRDLYGRLAKTAEQVCDSYAAMSRVTAADRACASKALADAVERLNQPAVTALHDAAHGRPAQALALRATP